MIKGVIIAFIFSALNCFLTAFFAFESSGGYETIYTVLAGINGFITIISFAFIVCYFIAKKEVEG